jgi:hypothetical protein
MEPAPDWTSFAGLGATLDTVACPELVTVMDTVIMLPSLTAEGRPLNCACRLAGFCTCVNVELATSVVVSVPVFVSFPKA